MLTLPVDIVLVLAELVVKVEDGVLTVLVRLDVMFVITGLVLEVEDSVLTLPVWEHFYVINI